MDEDPDSLEGVAGRLRRNEGGYSCVDIKLNPGYEARHLELLTEAILANETLEEVNFFGILADDDVNEAAKRLVQSFGTLPRLRSLKISGYCDDLLHVLSQLLRGMAENLRKFSIVYVQLAGNYQELLQSIRGLINLEELKLIDCQLPLHLQHETTFLDGTIRCISHLPNIRRIWLSPIHRTALGSISHDSLLQLGQIPILERLSISGFGVAEESCPLLGPLCLGLESNAAVQDVEISGSFSKENCDSIAQLIQTTTSISVLRLNLMQKGSQSDKHILELGRALQQNTSIRSLYIRGSNLKCGFEHLDDFGRLLEKNYAVQVVQFHGIGPSFSMGQNFSSPVIQFYLKLNQLSRGSLLQNANAEKRYWVEKLEECDGNIDCLFYFLSMNPSLCDSEVPNT